MSLLRWLAGKPQRTPLEQFCATATMDKAGALFDAEPNSLGLAKSFAVTMLAMADEFLQGAVKDKLVGGPGQPKPNVVLFEVSFFLWAAAVVPYMRWAQDELGLSEEHEVCNNVFATKGLLLGIIEKEWPGVSLDPFAQARLYLGKIDNQAAALSDWICSSAGAEMPASKRTGSMDVRNMPLQMSCVLFATHMVPTLLGLLQRLTTHLMRR